MVLPRNSTTKGFTLLEVLIVLALLGMVVGLVVVAETTVYQTARAQKTYDSIMLALITARTNAMQGVCGTGAGVVVGPSGCVTFTGSTWADRDEVLDTAFLCDGVTTATTTVIFSPLSGTTTPLTFTWGEGSSSLYTISLTYDGFIR